MREWTTEERYRPLLESDKEMLEKMHEEISQSVWRADFHVQTVTGLMGDTNGFAYWNGKWHLFFQWFAYGAVHGMKHWYHVESEDLVHWQNKGLALQPTRYEDNKGCFSGSGFPAKDCLYLAYTGNSRDELYRRTPYQLLAKLDKKGKITKQQMPIILPAPGYTEHQRDPKLFFHEGKYYILLGAQNDAGKGTFLLYRSDHIETGWELLGELKVRGYDDFGFMVECPDIERIGDDWMLMFSPQGLQPQGDLYRTKFNNTYFIGKMDFDSLEFIPNGPFVELDRGFDFYAAQCASQNIYPNAAVLEAWLGVSEYNYPICDEQGWAGLQTLARELTIKDGKLLQRPCRAAESIKGELLFHVQAGEILTDNMLGLMPSACVIKIEDPYNEGIKFNLFARSERRGFEIFYDKKASTLTLDRSEMTNRFNQEYGEDRNIYLPNGLKSLEIFVDHSTIEIFINDGEFVASSRIFPEIDENLIRMGGKDVNVYIWIANKTVEDDFIIWP